MEPSRTPRLSVVIPAYNEEQRLPGTLDDVLSYLARQDYSAEVLVVDDGSGDGTADAVRRRMAGVERVPVSLVAHPDARNRGKGAAVRRGMVGATGRFRLFMDADNSTTLEHVERFWPFFEAGFSAVIGSRDVPGSDVRIRQAWYRELAGKAGNLVIRALAMPGIHDTQTGFKMFTAECVEAVFPRLTVDRWGFDVEILAVCSRLGYRIKEVPVAWLNRPDSKVTLGTYAEVLREVWQVRRNLRARRYD